MTIENESDKKAIKEVYNATLGYFFPIEGVYRLNDIWAVCMLMLEILKKGSEKARIRAEENLKNIREKVGLI